MNFEAELEVTEYDSLNALEFLWGHFDQLSKSKIKDAMKKGAVFHEREGDRSVLRKAQTELKIGDKLEVFYDQDYLNLRPLPVELLTDQIQYSVWMKPAGMPIEGELFGDHLSLLRIADQTFEADRDAYLVYELADDSKGVLLIVHHRRSAAVFTEMSEQQKIKYKYRVEVCGEIENSVSALQEETEDYALCGSYDLVKYVPHTHTTILDMHLTQGDAKDICCYFLEQGHPVVGDEFISGNTDRDRMQVDLVELTFECPISGDQMHYKAY